MVKFILLLLLTLCCIKNAYSQNVGIGTSTPNSSAQLDINSNDKGILIPRMDNNSMRTIASPAEGLMVYNITDSSFYTYKTRWRKMSITLPYRDTVTSTVSGLFVQQDGTGNAITGFTRMNGYGVAGYTQEIIANPFGNSTGVLGVNFNTNGWGTGIAGIHSGTGVGVYGRTNISSFNSISVFGESFGMGIGVKGTSGANGTGVKGEAGDGGYGVTGFATGTAGFGILGTHSGNGYGVTGQSGGAGIGVWGTSISGIGGKFYSTTGIALRTEGPVQLTGIGEASGKVLISSSDGTANWGDITRTETISIPGSAFKSLVSSANYFATNGEAYSAGTGYQLFLETPLLIPNGAQLAGITASVMDNSSLKGITINLRRYPHTGGGYFTVATTGTTATDITGSYFSIAVASSFTINNYNESYTIEVEPTGDFVWPGDLIRIKAVRITYSYPVNQ